MKTLALLCPPIPPNHLGGDGKFAYDIALALSRKGIKIVLFTLLYNDVINPYEINENLKIIPIPIEDNEAKDKWDVPIWDPSFTKGRDAVIIKYLKEYGVLDGSHWLHEIGGSLYNSALKSIHDEYGTPYSVHMQFVLRHYFDFFPDASEFANTILKSQDNLVQDASLCMFLSSYDQSAFNEVGAPKIVVPNGTHLQDTLPGSRKINDALHIYYGGRLHNDMKGAAIILPVLSEVMKHNSGVILHISAPDRAHLDLIDNSVANQLIYHGWLTGQETLALIRTCDITLMPSIYEPFGLLAIESLAQGVPVLANEVGGLADIVIPGKNGQFIDLGNPGSIVKLLNQIAKDKKYINEIAPEPRYLLERYDIDQIADAYRNALKQLLC